jgi:hypothetical protein
LAIGVRRRMNWICSRIVTGTQLIYDAEVDPSGIVERVDFDKIFNWSFGEPVAKGKAPAPLTFVAFV